jgi:hypothetical protein
MPGRELFANGSGGGGGRCECIRADSSATDSSSASCFNRLADPGTSLDRARYGEMSAELEVRREPKARREATECVGEVAEAGASEPEDCRSDVLIAPFGRGLLKMSGDGDWKVLRGCKD